MDSPKAKIAPVATGNYSIQVGAFSKMEGATKLANDYQRRFGANKVTYEKVASLYKVFINAFKICIIHFYYLILILYLFLNCKNHFRIEKSFSKIKKTIININSFHFVLNGLSPPIQ